MPLLLALGIFFFGASLVSATVGVTYTNTTGSEGFDSNTVSATLDLSTATYFGASYNSYHSDNSSGTINTYYARLGHYSKNGSWMLFGSYTPEVNNYKETSAGGEFRTALLGRETDENEMPLPANNGSPTLRPPPQWHGDPRLDFTAGYTRDMFVDQGETINENDLMGGLGFNWFKTYLSGTFTKSIYDEEINGDINPNARRFSVGYGPMIIPGYPDYDYEASIDQTLLPGWWVLGNYTHLKYKSGSGDLADMYSVGTGITLFHTLLVTTAYTWYIPASTAVITQKQHFFSLGAGIHF
jgi:hypothetical protein